MTTIDHRIAGIPCQIEVTYFRRQKPWRGSAHTCPSSDDYYGYTECEFNALDRRGYPAAWLDKKVTDADRQRIIERITAYYEDEE